MASFRYDLIQRCIMASGPWLLLCAGLFWLYSSLCPLHPQIFPSSHYVAKIFAQFHTPHSFSYTLIKDHAHSNPKLPEKILRLTLLVSVYVKANMNQPLWPRLECIDWLSLGHMVYTWRIKLASQKPQKPLPHHTPKTSEAVGKGKRKLTQGI